MKSFLGQHYFLFSILFILAWPPKSVALDRLDPHGQMDDRLSIEAVKNDKSPQKFCLGCHQIEGTKLVSTAKAKALCLNCHNSSPHSGIDEHVRHKITCVSCHTFHRALGKPWSGPSLGFRGLQGPTPKGLVEKSHPRPMLKNLCTDCHKWK